MRVFITGATGFVGRHIVDELIKQSVKVVAIDINMENMPLKWNGIVQCIQMNIFDETEYDKLHGYEGDIFFHFAWAGTSGTLRGDVSLQLDNAKYACKLMEKAKQLGCRRFVFAGSIMEYEAMEYITTDYAKPGVGMIYSTAKLTADFMLKTLAEHIEIEYINILISNIYGVGERSGRFINTILSKMLKNERIELTHCRQMYDFVYVTDAAKAIVVSGIKGNSKETYYIGNKEQHPLRYYVEEMMAVTESKSELLYGAVPYNNAQLTYKEFDTKKVSEQLKVDYGYTFADGIKKTMLWMLDYE